MKNTNLFLFGLLVTFLSFTSCEKEDLETYTSQNESKDFQNKEIESKTDSLTLKINIPELNDTGDQGNPIDDDKTDTGD